MLRQVIRCGTFIYYRKKSFSTGAVVRNDAKYQRHVRRIYERCDALHSIPDEAAIASLPNLKPTPEQ
jgi:hypothetical protein